MKLLILAFIAAALLPAQTTQTQTCRPSDLPLRGSVEGTLQNSSCAVRDFLSDVNRRNRADAWKLVVTTTAVFRIKMSSTEVDSLLYIANSSGTFASDNNSGGGKDAELLVQLTPGTYTVVAVSGADSNGTYKITVDNEPPRKCATITQPLTGDADGDLNADDCRLSDLIPLASSHSPVDLYRVEVKAPTILTFVMTSSTLDSLVVLRGPDGTVVDYDDDSGGGVNGLDAKLKISLDPGIYTFLITNAVSGYGSYHIHTETEDRRKCTVTPIVANDSIQGVLETSDCRMLDLFAPETDVDPLDSYRIEIKEPVMARISMNSTSIDSYLYLLDATGRIIARNNDGGQATRDALIGISLAPGTYTVLATEAQGRTGPYTLQFATEPLRSCTSQPLNLSGSTTGTLSISDCRYLDAVQPSSSLSPASVFSFRVDTKRFVTLTGSAAVFAPLLELRATSGELVSSSTRSSEISMLVLPGEYKLIAYHRTGTGEIRIAATTREPASCPAVSLFPGTPVTGELTASDCPIGELVPIPISGIPADVFRLDVTESGKMTISINATGFIPFVMVFDADGRFVSLDGTWQAKVGTYQVVVTTLDGALGPYEIRATAESTAVAQ